MRPERGRIGYHQAMPEITIRFPDEVADATRAAARLDDRSLNGEVIAILRSHLTERGLLPPATDGTPTE